MPAAKFLFRDSGLTRPSSPSAPVTSVRPRNIVPADDPRTRNEYEQVPLSGRFGRKWVLGSVTAMDHTGTPSSAGGAVLVAEAMVRTERPNRYLVQLCAHISRAARANPLMQARADWSDDHGEIDFGWGRCTLRAAEGVLTLRVEAGDEMSLHRLRNRVAGRLEQIGRRDALTVRWTVPTGGPE
jgi:hypothetical protein